MSFEIKKYGAVSIYCSQKETEAVKIAAKNLASDLEKVFAVKTEEGGTDSEIVIGTIGNIDEYISDEPILKDHKEAYIIRVIGNRLVICGSDRRGTIYGIYELCEMIGVSPWYFFSDVPVKKKDEFVLDDGFEKADYPTVEYRGIFINDEEELEHWVQAHMGEETIGVKTYEKIFELLLRLKANYIWPAMHVNSFNVKVENGTLANKMGIVVGTSHCDMLMRSNNREWKPWLLKKGYTDVEYDYSIEGENREKLNEYWRESVEQNKDFEVSYTLGMRGVHDSGFETRDLKGGSEEEVRQQKIELLETIISAQRKILEETLDYEPLKNFVPYKEVLPLYDNGLNIPEDMTLIWSNDNYGYIRRYPGEREKNRKGGNGIYYHNSYWAPPGASYLFICSIPLAHTKNELKKAFYEGIKKLWVLNVGAIKPIEQEMEFFLRYAWDIDKENTDTDDVDVYLEKWIDKTFSGNHGKECARLLNDFSQLTNVRKVEHMNNDAFSQNRCGDEGAYRLAKYKEMFEEGNRIYYSLPEEEREAFYQLVLMKIHAAYFINSQYYFADRSALCHARGDMSAAQKYCEYSIECDDVKRRMLHYYNKVMCGGKWDRILTPEDFPPPVTAMFPAYVPPLEIPKRSMSVHLWNEENGMSFVKPVPKWIEIANKGEGELEFEISAPDWIEVSKSKGIVKTEERVFIKPLAESAKGIIKIENVADNEYFEFEVSSNFVDAEFVEDGSMISVKADWANSKGWREIKRLGRSEGTLVEAREEGAVLEYPIYCTSEGEFEMEIHRFPSLNSTGRIRCAVSVDDCEPIVVESESTDEHRGTWKYNITNNVDKLYVKLPYMGKGVHTVKIHAIDKYFAFTRFCIYTDGVKENNLGIHTYTDLPYIEKWNAFADEFFTEYELKPRPEVYGAMVNPADTLLVTDTKHYPKKYANKAKLSDILSNANTVFEENDGKVLIDAVTAICNSEYAYCKGDWSHCGSESYGRSSAAIMIRKPNEVNRENPPSLHYKLKLDGGHYMLWALTKANARDDSIIAVSLDGEGKEPLYKNGMLGRYEAEQIWRWAPIAEFDAKGGEHELTVHAISSGMRYDRLYISSGDEKPLTDIEWRERLK